MPAVASGKYSPGPDTTRTSLAHWFDQGIYRIRAFESSTTVCFDAKDSANPPDSGGTPAGCAQPCAWIAPSGKDEMLDRPGAPGGHRRYRAIGLRQFLPGRQQRVS